ncbi:hypothetical protein NDN08_003750 [Rhodosorus marinus]|uniref:BED-type domain-containing protein n=1 Tax=Rhodosorus marinus TaxID=101924 RepID=A0AAV8ULN1_9RHOD|nr:hypothetical protein NDN08_003750 [Rhodosorus marinus]
MGRRKDPIWDSFSRIDGKTGIRARCHECGHEMYGKVERMRKHVEQCHNRQLMIPGDHKRIADGGVPLMSQSMSMVKEQPAPSKRAKRIEEHFQTTPKSLQPDRQAELSRALAIFFVRNKIMYKAVEDDAFKKIVCPGFQLPDKKGIADLCRGLLDSQE